MLYKLLNMYYIFLILSIIMYYNTERETKEDFEQGNEEVNNNISYTL